MRTIIIFPNFPNTSWEGISANSLLNEHFPSSAICSSKWCHLILAYVNITMNVNIIANNWGGGWLVSENNSDKIFNR